MTQQAGQPETTSSKQSVPEPPRPLTPKARRRLWAEPQVRGWALFIVALLAGSVFVAIRSYVAWSDETRVIRNGVVVQAVAYHTGSNHVPGQSLSSTAVVDVEYTFNDKKYKSIGRQLYRTGAEYVSMKPFDIRVDPDNPDNWTNRSDVPSVSEELVGAIIMLIAAAICAAIMLVIRLQWLFLWRNGDLTTARVMGQSQSALAPRSTVLRCAVRAGKTDRLVNVYVPQDQVPSGPNPTIELIVSYDQSRALALLNYHG